MNTPSQELPAVNPSAADPEPAKGNGETGERGERGAPGADADPAGPPPWAEELLRLLREHGERLDRQGERLGRVEADLRRLTANLTVLGNAYRVQAQELTLIRRNCPQCLPEPEAPEGEEAPTDPGTAAARGRLRPGE